MKRDERNILRLIGRCVEAQRRLLLAPDMAARTRAAIEAMLRFDGAEARVAAEAAAELLGVACMDESEVTA